MGIVGKFRKLESNIARRLDLVIEKTVGREPKAPLEIVHAVLDAVEEQLQGASRGRRVFPFNIVRVHVLAATKADRARMASVLEGDPPLADRIAVRLRDAGCTPPAVRAEVKYASKSQKHWAAPECHVEFDSENAAPAAEAPAPSRVPDAKIELAVTVGSAERKTYAFGAEQINIGRRGDVRDKRQRFLRANHVVFTDAESDVNRSVSRRHAHIVHGPGPGEYRLCDDRSEHGTSIIRQGRPVPVPVGARGVRLQNGDEIVIGQARLKVKLQR